jgi:polyhydroxybutyrate depolymerase
MIERNAQGWRATARRMALSGLVPAVLWAAPLAAVTADGRATAHTAHEPGLEQARLFVGQVERTFLHYAPPNLPPDAPVVLVLHGAGGDANRIRGFVGRELERLARERGFVVVYPNGYAGHWNDCRANAPYPAKWRNIDDREFVRGMALWLRGRYGVDLDRIRVIGYSNGAHLAFRLALETPGEIQAIAAFGAGLPVAEELDCREAGVGVPVMLVNGTADEISPYRGGVVIGPDGHRLGRVRSATATAEYFARLAGYRGKPFKAGVLPSATGRGSAVRRTAWTRPGAPEVALYTIVGGGHAIPGPGGAFPAFLGRVEPRFHGIEEAVRFFDRQPLARPENPHAAVRTEPRDPAAEADLFVFRSDLLFNLHDFLVWNAQASRPVDPRPDCLAGLDPGTRVGYERAEAHYRTKGTEIVPFGRLAVALWFRLAGYDEVEILPPDALAETLVHLESAAPAYKACWWPDHDARNRAWIAAVVGFLAEHGDALRSRHAQLYGADWAEPLPVDVVGYVSPAGAGTVVNPDHILVSSADPRHAGEAALEIVFHEASHTLLGPGHGLVWTALAGADVPGAERLARQLWHPVLFYTTGKAVAERLSGHRGDEYEPYIYRTGLLDRAWPHLRTPLEEHWQPYVDGTVDLEEAARRLLEAVRDAP